MSTDTPSAAEACPVDHKTRQIWLDKARSQNEQPVPSIPAGETCDSTSIVQKKPAKTFPRPQFAHFSLDQSREISTIPRALPDQLSPAPQDAPANNEQESGPSSSGNWIYPSQQMFFDAMKRKNYDPRAEDMQSIVPIHNAVNERAWQEIKVWEHGRGSDR